MHNKIALKLTLYFAAVLLVFALVVGGSFAHFFRAHTIDMKRTELQQRAVRIAEVLSENARWLEERGGIANTRFISYINNITMEDVWVVDESRDLKLPQRMHHRNCCPRDGKNLGDFRQMHRVRHSVWEDSQNRGRSDSCGN